VMNSTVPGGSPLCLFTGTVYEYRCDVCEVLPFTL
jgi:hypothetical protein